MRVSTVFNRMLGLDGASVVGVEFTDDGLVVSLRRRAKVHRCPCGVSVSGRYDRSVRRWRHVDAGTSPTHQAEAQFRGSTPLSRVWNPPFRWPARQIRGSASEMLVAAGLVTGPLWQDR